MNINSFKDYNFAQMFELYGELLDIELKECLDEGRDLDDAMIARVKAIAAMPKGAEKEDAADALFYDLMALPIRADFPYDEPDDYEAILKARPADRKTYTAPAKDDALYQKIYGAWLGRICGCLLGKGVEGMKSADIERLIKAENNYPLNRYIGENADIVRNSLPSGSDDFGGQDARIRSILDCYNPGKMPPDDDTNYTVMAAERLVGLHGRDFTPIDVAREWMQSQPVTAYCTAEHTAVINMFNGIAPKKSACYKSPAREWIGAQIRADYFGYICPGDPESAARMAYNDACVSQVKNGIYGEMFIAAAIAAAAVTDDPVEVLYAGLQEIPERSRLTAGIRKVIERYQNGVTEAEALRLIHEEWDEYDFHHWCHTISNAMIVAACLLYGGLDYGKTICMAVQTGFDTDCNGATAGSIVGMMKGKSAIGTEWSDAINDTVETTIIGCGTYSLKDLSDLTMTHMA